MAASENIRVVGTIDLTPTWRAILPMLTAALRDGTADGQRIAREELERMADCADRWNRIAADLNPELVAKAMESGK